MTRAAARMLLAGLASVATVAGASAAPNVGTPLLAYRSSELLELQPLSLRTLRTARIPVPQVTVSWSRAPGGELVAIGGLERLVVFDVGAWRTRLSVRMPGYVAATAWSDHRLFVLVDEAPLALELMTLDRASGRVVQRRRLARQLVVAATYRGRIVAITAPAGAIGPAQLLVSGAGAPRLLGLGGIVAGWAGTRFIVPALTVVQSAGRAFVVGANGMLATVDLGHGTVAYRHVRVLTAAEKGIAGSVRHAAWLGGGHLAVSGWTERNRPAGLTLLDVHSGSSRLLDPSTDSLTAGHGTLLGYRFAFPPTREFPGGGVTFYDPSGRRRLHLLGRSTIAAAAIVGTRAYIDPDELHVLVVDLKTGKTVATAEGELPELLVGTPTWSRIQ